MDVLDMLDRLDQIEILFEPIYSADEHRIVAYEVIGQIRDEEKTVNIKQFTYRSDAPGDICAEIEQLVVRQSIEAVKQSLHEIDLYIPCNPNLLMLDFGESYFAMLKETLPEELLGKIILVMAEHQYVGDIQQLHHVVRYLKTYGIKVALQDVGSQSQLDHILLLEPTVLKINVGQLNYNLWGAQNHVFATLRALALKIGASLMIEEVETVYQLQHGWKNGARYYKGEYLERPQKGFIPRDSLKERFRDECEQFIVTEKKLLEQKYEEMKRLEKTICTIVEQLNPSSTDEGKLLQLAQALEKYAFRIYICNGRGFQTAPNIMWKDHQWEIQKEAKGKNWSWRPYFLLNIIKMRNDLKGEFSAIYSDIETGELTRTFSMALHNNEFLFVDISYDYLYEHNIVN
ncbi:EAL-associated domain-containing protein [Solibacillus sp. FSL H8-0538]|uniref:EAL-associated domain-containing protein n=1 Tax=Solibacillus sp. FSL H8-0538 TaxID=2921400 RepID=UPI0030FA1B2A